MTLNPKARLAAAYDAAADHFDAPPLAFRHYFGEQTVARARLRPGDIVLDVCCGAGASALPAARAVAPSGRVIGLDLAPRLISLARARASAQSLANAEFRHADFDQAYFRADTYDAVLCVFGLFFLPDPRAALRKMWRLLRPGGRLAVTTWGPGLLAPAEAVFWDAVRQVRPDLHQAVRPQEAFSSPELLRAVFDWTTIESDPREHPLRSPEDWWTILLGSGHRGTLDQLTPAQLEHVRAACLALTAQAVSLPALYAVAVK